MRKGWNHGVLKIIQKTKKLLQQIMQKRKKYCGSLNLANINDNRNYMHGHIL